MLKNPDSKANPKTQPGSLQRLVRQSKVHRSKNLQSDSLRQCGDDRPRQCARNVTAKHAKHTKRNPRHRRDISRPTNPTGDNGENRGQSNLCSLRCLLFKSPSVARSCRTTQAQRPGPRDAWIATWTRWPGSLQRMVRRFGCRLVGKQ